MPTRKQKRRMAAPDPRAAREGCWGVYIRRSEDDERSKSCDDQEQLGRRAGKAKGYPPERIRVYRETEGTKGTWGFAQTGRPGPHRAQLTRLVDDLRDGVTTHLWAWNSDRLVRDPQVCLDLCEELREHRVSLTINARDVDTSTSDGLYGLVQESIQNRRQRDRASEDGVRDKQFRAEMGLFTRDPSAYGWRSGGRESQEAIPQWQELAVVEMAMQWIAHGDGTSGPMGFNQVANRLMDLGIVLSVGARGHRVKDARMVTPAHVERIVTNCMHVGRWLHRGAEHDFSEKLLVSRHGEPPRTAVPTELYDAVQARLDAMPDRTPRSASIERLCKGIAVCGACGRPCHVNRKINRDGATERYFCPHRAGRRKTCEGVSYGTLVVGELEEWVGSQLAPLLADALRGMAEESAGEPLRRQLSLARRSLEEARRQEAESLVRMLGAGYDDAQRAAVAEALRAERHRREREVADVEARLARREASASADLSGLESASVPRLREALRRSVSWIALCGEGVVALGVDGRYRCSRYVERDLEAYNDSENRRRLEPRVQEGGRDWIAEPARFVAGRREALGSRLDGAVDGDVLPDEARISGDPSP